MHNRVPGSPSRCSDAHFVAFVHARSAALLRLAVLLTGDRHDGEDLLQIALFEDLPEQQTADLMGCSVGTVKSQTARGLAALRRRIGAMEADDRIVDET
jgi:DNA-directed RNA polymerase specialized sigma24 family protein